MFRILLEFFSLTNNNKSTRRVDIALTNKHIMLTTIDLQAIDHWPLNNKIVTKGKSKRKEEEEAELLRFAYLAVIIHGVNIFRNLNEIFSQIDSTEESII